jgi:hypothetical protein
MIAGAAIGCSGRSPDWITVENPDAPAATRVIEG